ncbi:MAG TPA: sensor histidine kinase, partial [Bryobacteraceae bacterium]|nr:sensor histidine kinase [Bryobacteraceae bacterium]
QHERVVLELIANQLGLYHFLADEITELSKTKQQLQSTVEAQRRMYEDFQHQVRSPIVSASRTIQEIVKNIPRQQESLAKRLSAVQGLCAQAERVARNLELFVALALEKQIQVRAKGLSSRVLLPLLVNSARDHQAVMPAYRNIRFAVDEDSVTVVDRFPCSADLRLLEQAINNVLDNAGKYSYPNTVVWISVGLMDQSTMLFISTTNMGHPIRGDEVKKVLDRGYRSESAISSTAEGHGIGLWIVQKILEAHKGRVTITPTSPQGVTDVRLVLPKAKVG